MVVVSCTVRVQNSLLWLEDNDSGRGRLDADQRVAHAVRNKGQVDVSLSVEAVVECLIGLEADAHPTEELATGLRDAVQEKGGRGADGRVNTDLDRGEDSNDDRAKPDDCLEGTVPSET